MLKYAEEIMTNMTKTLDDKEFTDLFKMAELEKTAGVALEAFKKDVDAAVEAGTDLELVYTKHLGMLQKEENAEPGTITKARQYMAEKAAGKQPGMTYPSADDECKSADCMECPGQTVAAEFALGHLVKIADALDTQGFDVIASIIDEAVEKVAKYKTQKGKDEKSPKGAAHKAPKEWFDKMKEDVKKKNPDYSAKRIKEIVGDIWDNQLSDIKRKNIYKKYGKTKNPNA